MAVYIAGEAERIFAEKDSQKIVIDEIVGLQFSMFLVSPTVWHVIAGFFMFRLFDIFKIFPARKCERFSGGVGIVADDIVAGIYANIALLLSVEFLHL